VVFQLPTDCIRVLRMEYDYQFAIYGKQLYTNESSANIEYIRQVTDPQEFSSGFISAFAARLASLLSYGITQSSTVAQLMDGKAKEILQNAKWSDAQEGIGIQAQYGSLVNSRGV